MGVSTDQRARYTPSPTVIDLISQPPYHSCSMNAPHSITGETLSHYRVLERIGAGGMGVVYRAHDERLDRDVALKVLPPGSLGDETARKRFRNEALTLSKLNHPNIAVVYDFDTVDDRDFL